MNPKFWFFCIWLVHLGEQYVSFHNLESMTGPQFSPPFLMIGITGALRENQFPELTEAYFPWRPGGPFLVEIYALQIVLITGPVDTIFQ